MDNIQLYVHVRLDTGEIFYIGIGNANRPWQKKSRNRFWRNIVTKHGYRVEVWEEGLTWQHACLLEIGLIGVYGRRDLGLGPLVNLTDGGDGSHGLIHSAETKAKLSTAGKGKLKGRTFPPRTAEIRAKISEANKGKSPPNKGKKLPPRTAETRDKISEAKKAYWAKKRECKLN